MVWRYPVEQSHNLIRTSNLSLHADVDKHRFALLIHAGELQRYVYSRNDMMRTLLFSVLFCFCVAAHSVVAPWHWVKASNNGVNGWIISQGKAEVSIKGTSFSAKLYLGENNPFLFSILEGTVTGEKLSVKETIQGSDFTGSAYRGTFVKKSWEKSAGTIGMEAINLADGFSMIGLTRSIEP